MFFANSYPPSVVSAPAYMHFWPSLSQKEHIGFSPGHLVFLRLGNSQLVKSRLAERLMGIYRHGSQA